MPPWLDAAATRQGTSSCARIGGRTSTNRTCASAGDEPIHRTFAFDQSRGRLRYRVHTIAIVVDSANHRNSKRHPRGRILGSLARIRKCHSRVGQQSRASCGTDRTSAAANGWAPGMTIADGWLPVAGARHCRDPPPMPDTPSRQRARTGQGRLGQPARGGLRRPHATERGEHRFGVARGRMRDRHGAMAGRRSAPGTLRRCPLGASM